MDGATIRLLEEDPDLGRLMGPERRAEARSTLSVHTQRLAVGQWRIEDLSPAEYQFVGLLLLDGIVAREVIVADHVSTELLGPGDLLRPWQPSTDASLLRSRARWTVLGPSRIALLDRRFAVQVARYPEVTAILFDRLSERAKRLATTQAISQLTRVDRRLVALFWHLAERWGRMTAEGVVVPLALSHRILGQLIGARRPTVSSAISDLARRGELVRREDGSWLLTGEPTGEPDPEATHVVQRRGTLTVPSSRPRAVRPRFTHGLPSSTT